MSRIGKQPIVIPSGVTMSYDKRVLKAKGPKGELELPVHPRVDLNISENEITVTVKNENLKSDRSLWGLFGSLVQNLVTGVTEGYEKKLEVVGVGYRVSGGGKAITLNLGFTHPIDFAAPEGVNLEVEKNVITVSGIDKQLVGQTAAIIRKFRKPEPYKGKGIRYVGEYIIRKAGKAAKKAE